MQKWVTEDWGFELTVTEGKAGHCRLGLEKGISLSFRMNALPGCAQKQWHSYTHGARLSDVAATLHTEA